jgi:rod shape-determining protein MreC
MPLKVLVQRFAFILLVGATVTMMIVDRVEPKATERLRVVVTDITAPILEFFSEPAAGVASLAERVDVFFSVYGENERLRLENERLLKWQAVARQVEHENLELRDMLNVVADPRASFISGRVIADSGGAFVRTVLINAGTGDGVAGGQAVVNGDGLVGRIVEAGSRSARVLLLTDLNSRIPVVIESSRERAILSGDNSQHAHLAFLDEKAAIKEGDRVVTSGHGGMFPPGIPIGTVSRVTDGGGVVEPFADWDRLEFVSVLNYVVPGVLPSTRRAGRVEKLP